MAGELLSRRGHARHAAAQARALPVPGAACRWRSSLSTTSARGRRGAVLARGWPSPGGAGSTPARYAPTTWWPAAAARISCRGRSTPESGRPPARYRPRHRRDRAGGDRVDRFRRVGGGNGGSGRVESGGEHHRPDRSAPTGRSSSASSGAGAGGVAVRAGPEFADDFMPVATGREPRLLHRGQRQRLRRPRPQQTERLRKRTRRL